MRRCLEALNKQNRLPDEIITIEDKKRLGPSWARNKGITKAKGDLIAFTDDDCVPPKDWLERLVKAIDRYKAVGAGNGYKETDPLLRDMRLRKNYPKKEQIDAGVLVGNTGNVMYKKSWLNKLLKQDGYIFNEKIKYSQDIELVYRLKGFGAQLAYVPVKMLHLRRIKPLKHLIHQFQRGIGIADLYYFLKSHNKKIQAGKSLIWSKSGVTKNARWLKAFWYKAIGPFGISDFERKKDFWVFWLGEKAQALGFIWGLITKRIKVI